MQKNNKKVKVDPGIEVDPRWERRGGGNNGSERYVRIITSAASSASNKNQSNQKAQA